MVFPLLAMISYYRGILNPTLLNYAATLECSLNTTWCFELKYMESDSYENDFVSYRKGCNDVISIVSMAWGRQERDGWLDDTYELFVELRHNCTDSGNFEKAEFFFPPVPVRARNAHIVFEKEITNANGRHEGTIGTVAHDYKD